MDPPLSQEERAERGGNREDQVEVAEREQVLALGLSPQGLVETAAARTVAVATRNGELSITCLMVSNSLWRVEPGSRRVAALLTRCVPG
jgi:hypothetical protein